jgi:hypothetical protein
MTPGSAGPFGSEAEVLALPAVQGIYQAAVGLLSRDGQEARP